MTKQEFNEKYKDYLEKGYYGLEINDEQVVVYLYFIFEDLIKIPGFKYRQIKLKFGQPRVYTNLHPFTNSLLEKGIEDIIKPQENDK